MIPEKQNDSKRSEVVPTSIPWSDIYQSIVDRKPLNIANAIIEVKTALRHGVVDSEFNFTNCVFRGQFAAHAVTFTKGISLIDCIFEDGCDLHGCTVRGPLLAEKVRFNKELNFETIAITAQTQFIECIFETRPNFALASFGSFTGLFETKFKDGVEFLGATFGGHLLFDAVSVDSGDVNLTWSAIVGNLSIKKSAFAGPVECKQLKAGSNLLITETKFDVGSTVGLSGASIQTNLEIEKCTFSNTSDNCLYLGDVTISGATYIFNSEVEGRAYFNRGDFHGVFGTNSTFKGKATFEGCHFHRAIRFLRGALLRGAEFYFSEFEREANFGGVTISDSLSLRFARFENALMFELKGDQAPDITIFDDQGDNLVQIDLRGATYSRLILPGAFNDLKVFAKRIPPAEKNSFIYLEQYLRQSGQIDGANYIRYYRNSVEGSRLSKFTLSWWNNRLRKWLTLYGTIVWPLIVCAIAISVFGLAIDYIPSFRPWVKLLQTISWTTAGLIVAFVIDVVRRNVWPSST